MENNIAIEYLNKLWHVIPSTEGFQFIDIITDSTLPQNEKDIALSIISKMEDILRVESCLDTSNRYGNLVLQLNEKGRAIKEAGSFKKYKEDMEEKSKSIYNDYSMKIGKNAKGNFSTGNSNQEYKEEIKIEVPKADKKKWYDNVIIASLLKYWWAWAVPAAIGSGITIWQYIHR